MSLVVEVRLYGHHPWRVVSSWMRLDLAVSAATSAQALGYETRLRIGGAA